MEFQHCGQSMGCQLFAGLQNTLYIIPFNDKSSKHFSLIIHTLSQVLNHLNNRQTRPDMMPFATPIKLPNTNQQSVCENHIVMIKKCFLKDFLKMCPFSSMDYEKCMQMVCFKLGKYKTFVFSSGKRKKGMINNLFFKRHCMRNPGTDGNLYVMNINKFQEHRSSVYMEFIRISHRLHRKMLQ